MSLRGLIAQIEYRLLQGIKRERHFVRVTPKKARKLSPLITTCDWGGTAAGNPDKKQVIPQKQQHERSAALELSGMQAAEVKTPMSDSKMNGCERRKSRALDEKVVDDMTSTCVQKHATADARMAKQ